MGMSIPRVGVDAGDFRLPTKEALRKAADLEFRAVELPAVAGDLAPENLSGSGRRHLKRYLEGLGLRLVALVADLPGLRLTDSRAVEERVDRSCRIMELAVDLNVRVVTAGLGSVMHPDSGEPSPTAIEALRQIGGFADSRGRIYAVRPSQDIGDRLAEVLAELGCASIHVGIDPAASVMAGMDPMAGFERFADRVSLVHVRDGTAGVPERAGHETRLGEGEVDLIGVVATLEAADYAGPYVLRCMNSQTPTVDLEHARNVLTGVLRPR